MEDKTDINSQNSAEEIKKLGNEAFAAKNYEQAITHYTEAIKIDPDNAIYYSNRSACFAFLKKWKEALEDAILCLSKDPKSVKGYYRLAQAQYELGQLEDAEVTIIAALKLDPENEPILKIRRQIASKKSAASKSGFANKTVADLDENQKKELIELQEQSTQLHTELRNVQAKLSAIQRTNKLNQVTQNYIETIDIDPIHKIPLYIPIGKTFVLSTRDKIESNITNETEINIKNIKDLEGQKEFLDRRINSIMQNMKDIVTGA